MMAALALVAAETRAHRLALWAGLAFGLAGLLFGALSGDDGVFVLEAGMAGIAIAVGLGASVVSRDLSERRLGFYLARPLSPLAYFAGKMSSALLLTIAGFALALLPGLLWTSLSGIDSRDISWSRIALGIARNWRPLLVAATFFVAAAAAAGGAARSRSRLLILDLVMLPLMIIAFLRAIGGTWRLGTSDVVIPQVLAPFWTIATLVLLLAGAAQVSLGRLDLWRGHLWLSAIAWSGLLACIGGIHLFSNAVASATPADLRLPHGVSLHAPQAGDHVMLEGLSSNWRGRLSGPPGSSRFYPGFLLDERGQFVRMGGLDGLTGFAWSPDGRRFAWSRDAIFGGGSGDYSPPAPLREIPGFGQSHWIVDFAAAGAAPRQLERHREALEVVRALSPSGGRVLMARGTSKLIVDVLTGETVASIPESPEWSHPRFLSETLVRTLRVGTNGQHRVVEWDVTSGRLSERGAIAPQLLRASTGLNVVAEGGRAWFASLTPTDDFERVLRYDAGGLFLHDLEGRVVATLVDAWRARNQIAGLLSGGRIGTVEWNPDPEGLRLRVLALDGRVLADARLPGRQLQRVGGESAPGLLALGVVPAREADQRETLFVDLATGSVVRREPGLFPALRRWQPPQSLGPRNPARGDAALPGEGQNPEPGSLATRLFLGDEGVVLLDPASGARSVIVRRRDETP